MYKTLVFCLFVLTFIMCSELTVESESTTEFRNLDYNYNQEEFETHFTNEIVQLGRVLFYDNILSDNGQVSCASCHKQEHSFGDDIALSVGFLQGETVANTPVLVNNYFNKRFFWNGRLRDFRTSVIQPIFNPVEMGLSRSDFAKRINGSSYYKELFNDAFGEVEITRLLLSEALAQFVGSMILSNSKFDQYKQGLYTLSSEEKEGMSLFEWRCNSCHQVLDTEYYEGSTEEVTDNGIAILDSTTSSPILLSPYSFSTFNRIGVQIRVPSLRNLSTSAPYMHDGRFATLSETIEHYNSGVTATNSLDERLKAPDGKPLKLGLSDSEMSALEAFLLTLNDDVILTDERFSDPFIR